MEKCFLRSTLAKRTCRSKTYHHLKVWGREQATRGTALIDLRRISCSGWYVAENSLVYNKVVSWPPMKWVQMSRTPRICARRAVTTGYSPKSRWQRIIRYLQVKRGNVDGKRNLDKKMHDVQFVRFFLCSHFCTHCYQHVQGRHATCCTTEIWLTGWTKFRFLHFYVHFLPKPQSVLYLRKTFWCLSAMPGEDNTKLMKV